MEDIEQTHARVSTPSTCSSPDPPPPKSSVARRSRLLELWQDPKVGLTGIARFRRKLDDLGIKVSTQELNRLLESRPEHALFQTRTGLQQRQAKLGNEIIEQAPGSGIQVDLMDMSMLATRNKHFAWILVAVDVFSRYAWAIPVKRKTQSMMKEAMKTLLKQMKSNHRRVTSDAGAEFCSREVENLFRDHNLEHFTAEVDGLKGTEESLVT